MTKRYAIIPTRDRMEKYQTCVSALSSQVDGLVTIAHMGAVYAKGRVIPYWEEPANISDMWNLGLELAESWASDEPYFVAVVNDDAVVPPNWMDVLVAAMEREGTCLASGPRYKSPEKLSGYAFVVRGGTIRADPKWAWYFSEDALVEASELFGGWTIVPDLMVEHRKRPTYDDPRHRDISNRAAVQWYREHR